LFSEARACPRSIAIDAGATPERGQGRAYGAARRRAPFPFNNGTG